VRILGALLAAALALCVAPVRAQDDDKLSIQPHLAGLYLGSGLGAVQKRYPPTHDWSSTRDRKHGVTRYRLEKGDAKEFPAHVRTLYLGFHWGDLVEIEAVYDEDYSRQETYEKLAGDYELLYGRPRSSGDRFWWDDGSTVLRIFPADLPASPDGAVLPSTAAPSASDAAETVAERTGVQIFRRSVFSGD
jgi:hypothetical protein